MNINKSFMDFYFSKGSIFRKIVEVGEWSIIIIIGLLLPQLKIPSFFPFNIIVGIILLLIGFLLHRASHKVNLQAHQKKENIKKIIINGVYSKIRHPGYVAYIIGYLGVFLIFRSLSMIIPIFVFSYIFYDSAVKEEKFLTEKFGEEYRNYMRKVPWKFIPGIF